MLSRPAGRTQVPFHQFPSSSLPDLVLWTAQLQASGDPTSARIVPPPPPATGSRNGLNETARNSSVLLGDREVLLCPPPLDSALGSSSAWGRLK